MEYERTKDGQIQADFARRIGQIVIQYGQLSQQLPKENRYEITLWISLLQALLTNCSETIRRNHWLNYRSLHELSSTPFSDEPIRLGLDIDCIEHYSGDLASLKFSRFLECLRDAASHPNPQEEKMGALPLTGYTTSNATSGVIEEVRFSWSPWVSERSRHLHGKYRPNANDKNRRDLEKLCETWEGKLGLTDLVVNEAQGGYLEIIRKGRPFWPEMRVKLNIVQLRTLTLELSQYLAEPLENSSRSRKLGHHHKEVL